MTDRTIKMRLAASILALLPCLALGVFTACATPSSVMSRPPLADAVTTLTPQQAISKIAATWQDHNVQIVVTPDGEGMRMVQHHEGVTGAVIRAIPEGKGTRVTYWHGRFLGMEAAPTWAIETIRSLPREQGK